MKIALYHKGHRVGVEAWYGRQVRVRDNLEHVLFVRIRRRQVVRAVFNVKFLNLTPLVSVKS